MRPTMLAARFHGPGGGLRVEPVEIPRPGPGDALLRVLAAGLCHTDLQFLEGVLSYGVVPLTLGHEIAGEVLELGEGTAGVAPGDRVVVYYYAPCGGCSWCATGQGHLCPNAGPQTGFSADGGFAQYVTVPARQLLPLPPALDPAEAATLACSAASAYHALFPVGGLRMGETAVIYGIGGVGLQAVQLARLAGARGGPLPGQAAGGGRPRCRRHGQGCPGGRSGGGDASHGQRGGAPRPRPRGEPGDAGVLARHAPTGGPAHLRGIRGGDRSDRPAAPHPPGTPDPLLGGLHRRGPSDGPRARCAGSAPSGRR